jgi:hypothetical protein
VVVGVDSASPLKLDKADIEIMRLKPIKVSVGFRNPTLDTGVFETEANAT